MSRRCSSNVYCADTITDGGKDWNYEQHKKVDIEPAKGDFEKAVGSHFTWETGIITEQLIHSLAGNAQAASDKRKEFIVGDLFDIVKTPSYNKASLTEVTDKEYDYTRVSAVLNMLIIRLKPSWFVACGHGAYPVTRGHDTIHFPEKRPAQ